MYVQTSVKTCVHSINNGNVKFFLLLSVKFCEFGGKWPLSLSLEKSLHEYTGIRFTISYHLAIECVATTWLLMQHTS